MSYNLLDAPSQQLVFVFNIKKHGVLNEEKIREEAKSVGEGD